MLISICLYMFNIVCAATGNMQNCPRQLAMQSWHCACMQDVNHLIKKKRKKKKKKFRVRSPAWLSVLR